MITEYRDIANFDKVEIMTMIANARNKYFTCNDHLTDDNFAVVDNFVNDLYAEILSFPVRGQHADVTMDKVD